jgi:hypothetical protein
VSTAVFLSVKAAATHGGKIQNKIAAPQFLAIAKSRITLLGKSAGI